MQLNKKLIIIGTATFIIAVTGLAYGKTISQAHPVTNANQRVFTASELARYDGTNPSLPIYLAFEGKVYNVTPGNKFYKTGGTYHFLAGRDSTNELHIAGGEIIKRKYQVIGILK